MGSVKRRVAKDVNELFGLAARHIAAAAISSVNERGRFVLALSGGSTPRGVYRFLATLDMPWPAVHLFWGDERCVPPNHQDSNYRMVRESLLDEIKIPKENVHRIMGELDPPEAARVCAEEIQAVFKSPTSEFPLFDLILLGMGPDGHTASLFPGTAALNEASGWVVANEVPQLNTRRITFTFPLINAAREVMFLVAGSEKADVLGKVMEGDPAYPSSLVRPKGDLLWFLDRGSGSGLGKEPDEKS